MPSPSRPWALVSPASRGIGLQLARRILQTTNVPVVATARKELDRVKSEILDGLKVDESRLDVLNLDVLGKSLAKRCTFSPQAPGIEHPPREQTLSPLPLEQTKPPSRQPRAIAPPNSLLEATPPTTSTSPT